MKIIDQFERINIRAMLPLQRAHALPFENLALMKIWKADQLWHKFFSSELALFDERLSIIAFNLL